LPVLPTNTMRPKRGLPKRKPNRTVEAPTQHPRPSPEGYAASHPAPAGYAGDGIRTGGARTPTHAAAPGQHHRPAAETHSGRFSARCPRACTPAAASSPSPGSPRSRQTAASQAPPAFCQHLSQRGNIQHRLRQQPLQLGVLLLKPTQPLGVGHLHAAILRALLVEGRIADPVLAA